ncbi:MAG: PhoU domain-containing protein [Solirubrobacteraceae bacterium]
MSRAAGDPGQRRPAARLAGRRSQGFRVHATGCLNREVFRRAVEIGTDRDRREWATTMMLTARALERIGDNAVDIGEQVAVAALNTSSPR